MLYTKENISIPDELLQYHEEGRVVFFCGAGISVNAGLPLFKGLTEEVINKFPTTNIEETLKSGSYEQIFQKIQVNSIIERWQIYNEIYNILSPDLSSDNALTIHECLLNLSQLDNGKIKLVTTNFDTLFDYAIKSEKTTSIEFPEYVAPALCIPENNWSGMVYLHGKLNEAKDDNLILSSGDYGKAYLSHGWASKFITELFRNNVVCFIGYSANDIVMRYMLDSISIDRNDEQKYPIYAIDGCKSNEHVDKRNSWTDKGVTPILYEVDEENSHHNLIELLQEWTHQYQHRLNPQETIKKFVDFKAGKTISPIISEDRLKQRFLWALSDPGINKNYENAKYFSELSDPCPSWEMINVLSEYHFNTEHLQRFGIECNSFKNEDKNKKDHEKFKFSILNHPLPPHLSDQTISEGKYHRGDDLPLKQLNQHLSNWVLRHVNNKKTFEWACQYWQKNETFKHKLERHLDYVKQGLKNSPDSIPDNDMLLLWKLFLDGHFYNPHTRDFFGVMDKTLENTEIVKSKVKYLLSPKLSASYASGGSFFGFESEEAIIIKPKVQYDSHNPIIKDIKIPLHELFDTFHALINDLINIMAPFWGANYSSMRSISDNPQNAHIGQYCEIIKGTRDCWVALSYENKERAKLIAKLWFMSEYHLLKRLALFTATYENIIDTNTAIKWITEIYNQNLRSCKREEMQLLSSLSNRNLSNEQWCKLQRIILDYCEKYSKKDSKYETSIIWKTLIRLHRSTNGDCKKLTIAKDFWSKNIHLAKDEDLAHERHEFNSYSYGAQWVDKNEIAEPYPYSPEDILKMLLSKNVDPIKFSHEHHDDDIYRKYKRGWELYIQQYGFLRATEIVSYLKDAEPKYHIPMMAVLLQSITIQNLNSHGNRTEELVKLSEEVIKIFPDYLEITSSAKFIIDYCDFIKYESNHYGNEEWVFNAVKNLYQNVKNIRNETTDDPINNSLGSPIAALAYALLYYLDYKNQDKNPENYSISNEIKEILNDILKDDQQSEAWGAIGWHLYNLYAYDSKWVENFVCNQMLNDEQLKNIILTSTLQRNTINPTFSAFIFPLLHEKLSSNKINMPDTLSQSYYWIAAITDWVVSDIKILVSEKKLKEIYNTAEPIGINYIASALLDELKSMNEPQQRANFITNTILPIWKNFIPDATNILNDIEHNVMEKLYIICLYDNTENAIIFNNIKEYLRPILGRYNYRFYYDLEKIDLNDINENEAYTIQAVIMIYLKKHPNDSHREEIEEYSLKLKNKFPNLGK